MPPCRLGNMEAESCTANQLRGVPFHSHLEDLKTGDASGKGSQALLSHGKPVESWWLNDGESAELSLGLRCRGHGSRPLCSVRGWKALEVSWLKRVDVKGSRCTQKLRIMNLGR